jgi:hypothetical protein
VERKKFGDFVAVDTKIRVKGIPKEPGVYQIFEGEKLIYVGSTRAPTYPPKYYYFPESR